MVDYAGLTCKLRSAECILECIKLESKKKTKSCRTLDQIVRKPGVWLTIQTIVSTFWY